MTSDSSDACSTYCLHMNVRNERTQTSTIFFMARCSLSVRERIGPCIKIDSGAICMVLAAFCVPEGSQS